MWTGQSGPTVRRGTRLTEDDVEPEGDADLGFHETDLLSLDVPARVRPATRRRQTA
jgi:hypothetical protein